MKYDPNLSVPPEILKMALEIDKWFKRHGCDTYCLGPICSRDYANAVEASLAVNEAQREALSCLDETDKSDFGPVKPHPKGGIYKKP